MNAHSGLLKRAQEKLASEEEAARKREEAEAAKQEAERKRAEAEAAKKEEERQRMLAKAEQEANRKATERAAVSVQALDDMAHIQPNSSSEVPLAATLKLDDQSFWMHSFCV